MVEIGGAHEVSNARAITWMVTGEPLRGVTMLVAICPCSLVLATPTAIVAVIGARERIS
jgi:cation transport ATPase